MDYLYYVEHSAESLQFFLWYYDYIQRWSQLSPKEKALSAVWDPDQAKEPKSRYITYSHKREMSDKMNKILSIMDSDAKRAESGSEGKQAAQSDTSPASKNFSRPRTPSVSTIESSTESTASDWQPCRSYSPCPEATP